MIDGMIIGCIISVIFIIVAFIWGLINKDKYELEAELRSKIYITNESEEDNRIQWIDAEKFIVAGRKKIRPAIGDYLDHHYKNGKIARFKFLDVDYRDEGNDLFYGRLGFERYITQEETPKFYL